MLLIQLHSRYNCHNFSLSFTTDCFLTITQAFSLHQILLSGLLLASSAIEREKYSQSLLSTLLLVNMNLTTLLLFWWFISSKYLCFSCELVASKNMDRKRQKLVLQSVFLLISLRGMISSFGWSSRKSPLTWVKGQLSGSGGWRILDLLDRDRGSGIAGLRSRIQDLLDPGSG